jgi:hypothetical protein
VGPMQAIMSGVITIMFYAMVIAAVWKLFLMAGDLSEIKTLLADIRRNTAGPAANPVPAVAPVTASTPASAPPAVLAGPISLESAEALLREVAEEEHALSQQAKTTT